MKGGVYRMLTEKEGLLVFVLNLNPEQETYSLSCKVPAAFR